MSTAQHTSSTPLSPPRLIFLVFSTKCKRPPLMNICIYSLTLYWLYRPSVKAHSASDFAQRNRKDFTWGAQEINLGQTHEDRVPTEVPSCSPTKHREHHSQHPYQGCRQHLAFFCFFSMEQELVLVLGPFLGNRLIELPLLMPPGTSQA